MKIISRIAIWIVTVVCFASCYDDKGNYDYHDLISLTLDTTGLNLSNGLTAYQFEVFTLDPKVNYAGDTADIDFVWKIYPQRQTLPEGENQYEPAKVLSHDAVFQEEIQELPGDYYLTFEVHDKVSDTKTYLTVDLTVESSLSTGLCVLDEVDGAYDLNLIKSKKLIPNLEDGREGVAYNIYSGLYDGQKIANGKFLGQFFPRGAIGNFLVFTEDGAYRLDENSFEVITDNYGDLFSFATGLTYQPQALVTMTTGYASEFLLNAGKIHTMVYMTGAVVFGDYLEGDYEAAPFMIQTPNADNCILIFDDLNKRFLPIGKFGVVNAFEATPGAAFDVNNIDKELVALEGGYNNLTYAVFHDEGTSNYYLYEADFSNTDPLPMEVYPMSTICPSIDENTIFAFGNRGAYCFYASGNQLYKYNYTSGTCEAAIPAFASENITAMKVFKSANHALDGRLLIVATYNETSAEGKIYFLDFNELSGTVDAAGLDTPYTGFGRVKDFVNK